MPGAGGKRTQPSIDRAAEWCATRVRDENTNKVSFYVEFPTNSGSAQEVFPVTAIDDWKKDRNSLREYMAIIPGDEEKEEITFLKSVFEAANEVPLIGTKRPGFTDTGNGFVLETAPGASAGLRKKSLEAISLLRHSSIGTCSVLVTLASATLAYLRLRGAPGAASFISETVTFNKVGDSVARQSGWEGGEGQECILTVAAD